MNFFKRIIQAYFRQSTFQTRLFSSSFFLKPQAQIQHGSVASLTSMMSANRIHANPLLFKTHSPLFNPQRYCSTRESVMKKKLSEQLKTDKISIQDTSGGCGSFYSIEVHSEEFKGKSLVQQHLLVKKILADFMSDIHGLTLKTKAL